MADLTFNIAKGRVAELYNRVQTNDPTNSALIVVAINTSATDATLKDYDTLSAVLGDANTSEASNTNYARKTLTDTDLSAISANDTDDRMDLDFGDQTWSAVAGDGSPNAWTDLLVCYDNDTGAGTDANIIPLTLHDFSVTPDGSDITATVNDFFRAS